MTKDPQLYIHHILKSIFLIEEFTVGSIQETFGQERMRYDTVLRFTNHRNLQISHRAI